MRQQCYIAKQAGRLWRKDCRFTVTTIKKDKAGDIPLNRCNDF